MITRAPSTSSPLSTRRLAAVAGRGRGHGEHPAMERPHEPRFRKAGAPSHRGPHRLRERDGLGPRGRRRGGAVQMDRRARSPFGDMISSGASTDSNLAEFDGPSGQKLKDGGLAHADTADAIALRHARLHLLNSTGDHASGIGPTRIMIADANGLPAQGTSTDAQVLGAVGHKATEDAIGPGICRRARRLQRRRRDQPEPHGGDRDEFYRPDGEHRDLNH